MKYPNKPGMYRDIPTHRRNCQNCKAETRLSERLSDREQIDKYTDRIDYWCPICDEYIGTKVDYCGPVPVEIGPGVYELQ